MSSQIPDLDFFPPDPDPGVKEAPDPDPQHCLRHQEVNVKSQKYLRGVGRRLSKGGFDVDHDKILTQEKRIPSSICRKYMYHAI
jgi:hypothetical protein